MSTQLISMRLCYVTEEPCILSIFSASGFIKKMLQILPYLFVWYIDSNTNLISSLSKFVNLCLQMNAHLLLWRKGNCLWLHAGDNHSWSHHVFRLSVLSVLMCLSMPFRNTLMNYFNFCGQRSKDKSTVLSCASHFCKCDMSGTPGGNLAHSHHRWTN